MVLYFVYLAVLQHDLTIIIISTWYVPGPGTCLLWSLNLSSLQQIWPPLPSPKDPCESYSPGPTIIRQKKEIIIRMLPHKKETMNNTTTTDV